MPSERTLDGPLQSVEKPCGSISVTSEPEARDLERERLAERLQPPLRGVVEADFRERGDAADRGHLDDVAGALLAHDRQRRLGHPEGAEEVRLDLVAGLRLADLLDRAEVP